MSAERTALLEAMASRDTFVTAARKVYQGDRMPTKENGHYHGERTQWESNSRPGSFCNAHKAIAKLTRVPRTLGGTVWRIYCMEAE